MFRNNTNDQSSMRQDEGPPRAEKKIRKLDVPPRFQSSPGLAHESSSRSVSPFHREPVLKPQTLTLTKQTYLEHKLKLLQQPEL